MKALTIAIALIGTLSAAYGASLRDEIEAPSQAIASAMMHKDFPKLTKLLRESTTRDFKYVENGQTQDLNTMLKNMKMGISMITKFSVCNSKLLTIKQNGNSAIGITRHAMVGTVMGQDKKPHSMSFMGISEDTYVKQKGKWKMSSMTWKSQKQMMDGKVMGAGK